MADWDEPLGAPVVLEESLRRAAAAPTGGLDIVDLQRRVRRIRRNHRIGTVAIVLALLAPLVLTAPALLVPEARVGFLSGGGPPVGAPTDEPSGTPTADPAPEAVPSPALPSEAVATPAPTAGTVPAPSATATATATPTRQSSATVVISDAPGAPERRPDLPGDPRHPDVLLTLVLDGTTLGPDDELTGRIEVHNRGDEAIVLGDVRCWAVWGLYRDGRWRGGQPDSSCDTPQPRSRLEPGASWSVPLRFDARTDPEPGAGDPGERGDALAPGDYEAAAGLRVQAADQHDYSGVWYAPSVTVTVTGADGQDPDGARR